MGIIHRLYDQMAEMLALIEPEKLAQLKASDEIQKRFNFLLDKKRNANINAQEKDELDHFIVLERLIRLAKLRADQTPNA